MVNTRPLKCMKCGGTVFKEISVEILQCMGVLNIFLWGVCSVMHIFKSKSKSHEIGWAIQSPEGHWVKAEQPKNNNDKWQTLGAYMREWRKLHYGQNDEMATIEIAIQDHIFNVTMVFNTVMT